MIHGFQHVGIGVSDMEKSYHFYKNILGFKVTLNDHEGEVPEMERILGSVERMRLIMAMNLQGGGVVEFAQHLSSEPRFAESSRWGDLGYLSAGLKAYCIEDVAKLLKDKGVELLTPVIETPVSQGGLWKSLFIKDPDGIILELLETAELRVSSRKPRVGGFSHVTVGVSDMDASLDFYSRILGYDVVVLDSTESQAQMENVTGGTKTRTVFLKRSKKAGGPLPLEGGMVRLVKSLEFEGKHIYEGRRWGDVGIMEMALDVASARQSYDELVAGGASPFCEPTQIDMGMGSVGTFAYVKDPNGNIVELVEVNKLGYLPPRAIGPVLKAILRLRSRL